MTPPVCNAHGVYQPHESLTLACDRRGWRGMPTAELELAFLGTHWIYSVAFPLLQGDSWGRCEPLTDSREGAPYARRAHSREAAIEAACASLRKDLSARAQQPGDARRIVQGLDTLRPVQMERAL